MAQSFSVKAVLQAVDENFTSTTNKAMQMMNKLGATSNTVSNSVSKSGNSMTGTFKSVASGMGLVAVAGKAFDVIKSSVSSAVSRIDTLNNSNRTFANMNFSANQTKSAMNGLQASIKGLPTSLDSAVKGVQMIAASTGNLGKSQKVWSALNDAIIGFGGSTADVSNATIQLSQAFANGKIDGMTWMSMMNSNMGPVLNAIAKQLGMTTGELKDGLSSGKISTKEFMDALISLDKNGGGGLKSLHQIAMDSTSGIGTAIENMKTAITRGVGKAILAFSKFSEDVTGMSIADIITNIGNVAEQSFNKIGPALQKTEPFFKSLFSTIQGLFNFVNQNKDWLGPLAVSVVTFIGAFKGVQAAATGMRSLITGFQNLQAFVQLVAGAENSIKAFFTLLGLNPWVVLIAGIAAVVAGLVWFFTQTKTGQKLWQQFTTALSQSTAWQALVVVVQTVWNSIKTIITGAMNIIMTVITTVLPIIQAVFSTGWQILVTVVSTVWNIISTVIQTVLNVILSVITMFLNIITGNWSGAWENLKTIISVVFNGIVSIISSILSGLANIIFSLVMGIVNIWNAVWNGLVNIIKTIFKTIINVVSNNLKGMVNLFHIDLGAQGRAIMDSFLNGLKSAWEAVKSFVGGIGSWIKKHKGPISYDRKLLIPAGVAIMTGFNEGLQNQFSVVQKGVSNMAGAVSDAVSSNLETIAVPRPDTRDFMNTMNALQSASQNLYRQHSVSFGGTFSDNLTIDSPTMAQENNSLLRKLANKQQDIYLDGDVLVGSTYDRYDNRLGNRVNLKGRWS